MKSPYLIGAFSEYCGNIILPAYMYTSMSKLCATVKVVRWWRAEAAPPPPRPRMLAAAGAQPGLALASQQQQTCFIQNLNINEKILNFETEY